jgi:hypothetical protein
MAVERWRLGTSPRVEIVSCGGDLEIRGWDEAETRIDSREGEFQYILQEGSVVIETLPGDGLVRLPSDGAVWITSVAGNLQAKDFNGSLEIVESVGGDCYIRRCGPLTLGGTINGNLQVKDITGPIQVNHARADLSARRITSLEAGRVAGVAHVREATGPVRIEAIGGDVLIRDVTGPITVGRVGGDFVGRDIPAGAEISEIGGSLVVRTNFRGETSYRFSVGGDALFRIQGNAGVRFIVPAGTRLLLDEGVQAVAEGEQLIVTFGDGAAAVYASAGGDLRITQRGSLSPEDGISFTFERELYADLSELTSRLDEQFSRFEAGLSQSLSERIRQRVERELSVARRHVEEAQRRVEEASSRGRRIEINLGVGSQRGRSEPVSDQERLAILRMLEEKKITVEQAEQLLASLEGES